jgi:L-threonylcarbamoyladenylate synthase
MKTEVIPAGSPDSLAKALEVLHSGGLVAFPTDTVYGLGALAFDGKAVKSIYTAKNRPVEKAIPILIADIDDMEKIGVDIPDSAYKLASRFWPGPLTCIIPKVSTLPEAVSATSSVGVRVPDHEVARSLLREAGPMAVTSGNISGQQSPSRADDVYAQLKGRIPLIIDGGRAPGNLPSTVVDCTGSELTILRTGSLSLQLLISVL